MSFLIIDDQGKHISTAEKASEIAELQPGFNVIDLGRPLAKDEIWDPVLQGLVARAVPPPTIRDVLRAKDSKTWTLEDVAEWLKGS